MTLEEMLARFPMSIWNSDGKWFAFAWHKDDKLTAGPQATATDVATEMVMHIHTRDVMRNFK